MDLALYKVGASGRVALGDLADGVEFYRAEKDDNGTVTLTPVRIIPATGGKATETTKTADEVTNPGPTPWDNEQDAQ